MSKVQKTQKKRKVAIIAGSRGEYGYFRPVIREIMKRPDMEYGIVAANMHVLETFGSSVNEIEKDGFNIEARIFNTLDGYNKVTMAKSLAIFMLQLPEVLDRMQADVVLIAGDRGEQAMAAVVAAHLYVPVAHIQAGEKSGNIDGVTRHAITKWAHIHFCANEDAAVRVERMGEEKWRIHEVGASQLDELVQGVRTSEKDIRAKFNLKKGKPVFIVVYHPVTEEFEKNEQNMEEVLKAVKEFDAQVVLVKHNSDAGAQMVQKAVEKHKLKDVRMVPNMPREDYAGLLSTADVIVGNSSSGILEAPTFELPAVNIGRREDGRIRGKNVIDVPEYSSKEIVKAIKQALAPGFKESLKGMENPYGDGYSSKRIVDVLATLPIDDKLLIKQITY